jgi:N-acetylglucosamine-6-phosphate deacetylase
MPEERSIKSAQLESWGTPEEQIVLTAGMIDLQMNGGGGAQFNEDISSETIEKMYSVC